MLLNSALFVVFLTTNLFETDRFIDVDFWGLIAQRCDQCQT